MTQKIQSISVLIVDAASGMRSQLRNMLALCGISKISLAVTAGMAIRRLRENHYDIVLCEYHLGEGQDGQHLLEDLRTHKLIPLSTLFLMITGESHHEKVISAAELAPNDYILKPFSADKLLSRLSRALSRRDVFLPIYTLIEAGRPLEAIALCRRGEAHYPDYLIDFLRLRAELHSATGQSSEAQAVYAQVLETRAVPWARLGLARALFQQKDFDSARGQLEALLGENDMYLDAYDLLAQTREACGQLEAARDTLAEAVKRSPHTLRRLRRLGAVAAATGDLETATRSLQTVVTKGRYSDFRDPEDHLMLVRAQLAAGDATGATNTVRDLERASENLPAAPLCKAVGEAMLASHLGDADKLAEALDTAFSSEGGMAALSPTARQDLARLCLAHQQEERAAELVMGIMREASDDEAVSAASQMLSEMGRAELGERLAGHVREEVRDIMSEGARLAQSGDYAGAVAQMQAAAERMPGNTNVAFNAALALLKHIEHLGRDARLAELARGHIDRIQRQDPANPRLAALVNYYHQQVSGSDVGRLAPRLPGAALDV